MGLPRGYSFRPPARDDAGVVAGLLAACSRVDGGSESDTAEHVLDDWHGVDLAGEAVLVLDAAGSVAGYADVVNRAYVTLTVYGYVHPDHRGRGIGGWLVSWGEGWMGERRDLWPEETGVVKHYVVSTNEDARRLLEDRGYEAARGTYVMEIDLNGEPPAPEWPEGVAVRAFVPGRDERPLFEAVEDAFRDVWDRPPGTFERFVGKTEGEHFDPALWSLATEGGEIVGAVLGKVVSGEGWIEVVGVRRPWRRRGLGLALLRQALGVYRRRGVRNVQLSVDAHSVTGAPRLYGRAGMSLRAAYVVYRKALPSGGS